MGDEIPAENPWTRRASGPAKASQPAPSLPAVPLGISSTAKGDDGDKEQTTEPSPAAVTQVEDADAVEVFAKGQASSTSEDGGRSGADSPAPYGKGCMRATCRCLGTCHASCASSWALTMALLIFLTVVLLSDFIYSLVLLTPTPFAGVDCSTASPNCAVAVTTSTCLSLGGGIAGCSGACNAAASAGVAPLRITAPGAGGDFVYCPFPNRNIYFRLPTAIIMAFAAACSALSMIKRWRDGLIAGVIFAGAAGGVYFYVMIVDSSATLHVNAACADGLSMLGFPAAGTVTCATAPFIAISVLDAGLSLLCLYTVAVLFTNCRRISAQAAMYKADAPKRAAASAAAKEAFAAEVSDVDPAMRPFT